MANAYGTSINTTSPTFAPLTDDAAILRQWVTLQLQTSLGFYWSAPEIGCDLQTYVLRGLTPNGLAKIPSDIETALGQDERIGGVTVGATTSYSATGESQVNLKIIVTPKDTSLAPFSLSALASGAVANQVTQGLGV